MVTFLSFAIVVFLLAAAFGAGWLFELRVRQRDAELRELSGALDHLTAQVQTMTHREALPVAPVGPLERTAVIPARSASPLRAPPPAEDAGDKTRMGELPRGTLRKILVASSATPLSESDALEVPAALIGTHWKNVIDRCAPILGTTPVALLRAAVSAGMTGGRPITEEMLDKLEELVQAEATAPPSKPGRSGAN
jgi:hypothetical protein